MEHVRETSDEQLDEMLDNEYEDERCDYERYAMDSSYYEDARFL